MAEVVIGGTSDQLQHRDRTTKMENTPWERFEPASFGEGRIGKYTKHRAFGGLTPGMNALCFIRVEKKETRVSRRAPTDSTVHYWIGIHSKVFFAMLSQEETVKKEACWP